MQGTVKRAFAIVLLALMLLQTLPASLGSALAEGVVMVIGMLESPPQGHFSVAYVDFDDSEIMLQYVLAGGASVQPPPPARPASEGISYSFSGWQSTPDGITPDNITADVVFRATYAEAADSPSLQGALGEGISPLSIVIIGETYYEVEFVDHDGTPLHSQLVAPGEAATAPQNPTRATLPADGNVAWEFEGWVSENPSVPALASITDDVVFRAKYAMLEMTPFTVNYVLEAPDASVHLPPTAIHYYKVGETANVFIEGPMVPGYKPSPDPVEYYGVMGDDPSLETVTVTYKVQGDLQYNVRHWFEADNMVANDVDPTPGTAGHFTLASELNENSLLAPYGALVTLTDKADAKPGYTMMTQVMTPLTDNNTTYNVYYKKNTYTLTYDSNAAGAEVPAPVTIKAGNSIIIPTPPKRTGYSFLNWFANAEGMGTPYSASNSMPAEDLTLYGTWIGVAGVKYKLAHWLERTNIVGRSPDPTDINDYIWIEDTNGLTGTAGQKVDIAVINANLKKFTMPTKSNITYARYQAYDTDTTINGDGTTVINVYYSRDLFTFRFVPGATGTFPGLNQGDTKDISFKYGEYLLNYADPDHSWPYPVTPNEPQYPGTSNLEYWQVPGGTNAYSIRDSLGDDFFLTNAQPTGPISVTAYVTTTATMMLDLYCFEKLPHETELTRPEGGYTNPNYTVRTNVVSRVGLGTRPSVTFMHNSVPGYTRLVRGSTSHGAGTTLTGFASPGCDGHGTSGSVGTYDYGPKYTVGGANAQIGQVYFERVRCNYIFDKNTSDPDIYAPPTVSQQMYGLRYSDWPAATRNALDGTSGSGPWVANVSPFYTDKSGVTWTFSGWHEFKDEDKLVTFSPLYEIPPQNMTVYAHWEAQDVTVRFMANGMQYGSSLTLPAYTLLKKALPATDPVKAGYTFTGWYFDGVRYSENFELKSDITLEAGFTPNSTTYTIRYLNGNGQSLHPDYTVSGVHVDDKIRVPEDETPPVIAGFTLDSTTPAMNTYMTLVEDGEKNIITFRYKLFDGFKYNIHYVLESDSSFKVFPSDMGQNTWAEQQVIWAKKDPARKYYPVLELQTVKLNANTTIDITFYYRPYSVVPYAERSFLYNASGQLAGVDEYNRTAEGRIGETVIHSDTRGQIVYGGKNYKYVELMPANVQSKTIKTASDSITLVRSYMLYHTIKFVAGPNGTLGTNAAHEQEHPDSTAWTDVTVPTPLPSAGYYFAGWSPVLPKSVTEDKTYTATFVKKDDLVITANSGPVTYNGAAQSLPGGFTFTVNGGLPPAGLSLSGFTVTTATGTNVGTYPNAFQNEASLVVTSTTLGNVTERYAPKFVTGSLEITQREITVAPRNATVTYTGLAQTSPYGNELVVTAGSLVSGHTAEATVAGGGTTTTGSPYTLSIVGGISAVTVKDSTSTLVTGNYKINIATGTLTITGRAPGDLIPLSIQPAPVTETYTGSLITGTTTTASQILVNSLAVPAGTTVTFKATGSATNVGTHNVLAVIDSGADKWKVVVNGDDMSANYTLSPVLKGDLIIEQAQGTIPLVITPNSVSLPYNGQAQTANVYDGAIDIEVEGVMQHYADKAALLAATGLTLTFTATETKTTPGNYTTKINAASVSIMMGATDVTGSYKRTYNEGPFTITDLGTGQKIPLSIELNDVSRKYNGHAQTVSGTAKQILVGGTEIGALNAANGNVLTVEFTATGTGTVPNATGYPIAITNLGQVVVKLGGVVVTQNYDISQITSKLTIQPLTGTGDTKIPLVITPADRTKPFNGAEQTITLPDGGTPASSITVNGTALANFNPGTEPALSVTFKATATGFEPKNYYPITVVQTGSDKLLIIQDGVDVTENFAPTYNTGKFIITALTGGNRIGVTISPDRIEKYYTGETINVSTTSGQIAYSNTGGVTQQVDTTFTAKSSGLVPGNYDSTIAANDWDVKTPGNVSVKANYIATLNKGVFEIKHRDGSAEGPYIKLVIAPNDQTRDYSGVEQVVTVGGAKRIRQIDPLVSPAEANLPSTLRATFQATGIGTEPNVTATDYPIEIHVGVAGYTDFWAVKTAASPAVDVSQSYQLVQEPGHLEIKVGNKKPTIVITPNDHAVNYNGVRQSYAYSEADGYTQEFRNASGASVAWPVGLSVEFDAQATDVLAPGTYNIVPNLNTVVVTRTGATGNVKGDYNIVINTAKLTVNKLTGETGKEKIQIAITPETKQEYFTGKPISVTVTQGTVLHGGAPIASYNVIVEFSAAGTGFFPGEAYSTTINPASFKVYVKNANGSKGADITENYELVPNPGVLTILAPLVPIPMTATPANRTYDFDNTVQTATIAYSNVSAAQNGMVKITQGGKTEDISAYGELLVTFMAEGSGQYPDNYPITILSSGVQVFATYGNTTKNVAAYFAITPKDGTLTIRKKLIPVTVGLSAIPDFTYNALFQGFDGFHNDPVNTTVGLGEYAIEIGGTELASYTIIINKAIKQKNAGVYPISFTAQQVVIMDGTRDITANFAITTQAGQMKINPKLLIGKLIAKDPVGGTVFTYGDDVQPNGAYYDFTAPGDAGFEPGDAEIPPVVTRTPDGRDAYVSSSSATPIQYTFLPALKDPAKYTNYDTSGLVMVESVAFTFNRAQLTVEPIAVKHPQFEPKGVLPYKVLGLQYRETKEAAGLTDVVYETLGDPGTMSAPADIVGSTFDITNSAGSMQLKNYEVTYNNLTDGFTIYGWVEYHGNYPWRDASARAGEYFDPTDPVELKHPVFYGLEQESLRFEKWTFDKDGTQDIPDGTPIGDYSYPVYAQWTQLYLLTVHHRDMEENPIMGDDTYWLEEGATFTFNAIEYDEYKPEFVEYVSEGVTYRTNIGNFMYMPAEAVEATIYYSRKPMAAVGMPPPLREATGDELNEYWIYDMDIPRAGVFSVNMGLCAE